MVQLLATKREKAFNLILAPVSRFATTAAFLSSQLIFCFDPGGGAFGGHS